LSWGARELRKELVKLCRFGIAINCRNGKKNTNAVGRLEDRKKIDNGFESRFLLQGKVNFLLIFSLLFGAVFNTVVAGTVSFVLLVSLAFSARKKV
jgi:hypothetical protein